MAKKQRRKASECLPVDQKDGTSLVPLNGGLFAVINTDDAYKVSSFIWHRRIEPDGNVYAATNFMLSSGKRTVIRMHRLILCFPLMQVDHINHCGIDNRRSNLRLCDDQLNQANSRKHRPGMYSKYKGVSLHKSTGLFRVQLMKNRKVVAWSYHKDDLSAALAYDAAATEHFGEFAATNASLGLLEAAQ